MKIEVRSFAQLGKDAAAMSDGDAEKAIEQFKLKDKCVGGKPLLSATKLYLAVKNVYDEDPENTVCMGINCLNESYHCDTTPCLAWNLLWNNNRLIWGCEGDTMTMMTEYMVKNALQVPFFMTNLYPFLMGKAALAHERIPHFPEVDEPENHILLAHCGYFGLLPEEFAAEWALRNRVLAMVDPNATVIDARMAPGPITFAKIQPYLKKLSVSEAELTGYIQYEDSDCLNGGIVKVKNGPQFVQSVASHHYIVMPGHHSANFKLLESIYDIEVEEI
jgi:L-fucose isomerase-like protein